MNLVNIFFIYYLFPCQVCMPKIGNNQSELPTKERVNTLWTWTLHIIQLTNELLFASSSSFVYFIDSSTNFIRNIQLLFFTVTKIVVSRLCFCLYPLNPIELCWAATVASKPSHKIWKWAAIVYKLLKINLFHLLGSKRRFN